MKLSSLKPSNIVKSIAEKLIVKQLVAIAEGKRGATPAKVYAWLKGRKTGIGTLIGTIAALAFAYDEKELAAGIGTLAAILVGAGLADKSLRNDPPLWSDWWLYRFLVARSADVAAALVAGAAYVYGPGCEPLALFGHSLTCATQAGALGLIASLLIYVGVIDTATLSEAPFPKYVRDRFGRIVPR